MLVLTTTCRYVIPCMISFACAMIPYMVPFACAHLSGYFDQNGVAVLCSMASTQTQMYVQQGACCCAGGAGGVGLPQLASAAHSRRGRGSGSGREGGNTGHWLLIHCSQRARHLCQASKRWARDSTLQCLPLTSMPKCLCRASAVTLLRHMHSSL